MNTFTNLLEKQLWNNTFMDYLIALGVFLGLLLVFYLFKSFLLNRLLKLVKRTKNEFDDLLVTVIEEIPRFFYTILAIYIPLKYLNLPQIFDRIVDGLVLVLVVYEVIKALQTFSRYAIKLYVAKQDGENDHGNAAFQGLYILVKIVLWSSGLLLILSNLGINVTSLVASLGIGGIAVALAAQSILGDVFSSFTIYFDEPFAVGDFIVVGENMGTVKRIGFKSTRIETLHGEELVISNTELTNARVQNYRRMKKRRIVMKIGVVYNTKLDKLKKVKEIIEKAIKSVEDVDLDRLHFYEFGDYSLNFEVVYYVLGNDYNLYMDKNEQINFAIFEGFEKNKIEFAYPTQTVFVEK